jgi:branched-chain amino acid transport system substrate-binding protein
LPVGALYPLSGSSALLGNESFRGLELATDAVNAAGGVLGRPVRLVKGDAVDVTQAADEANRLISVEKVSAVFGTYGSGLSLAATQVAELAGVPYFELGAVADAITERGFTTLYRSCPRASQIAALAVAAVGDVLAPLWRRDPATLRLAILHDDGLYGATMAGLQERRCKERHLALVETLAYPAGATDFAPLVQRLRAAAADIVLHSGFTAEIVQFYRAMKAAGWRPGMVIGAGAGYSMTDTMESLGAAFDGTMNASFTPYRVRDTAAPGAAALAVAYQKRYGAPPRSDLSLANAAGADVFYQAINRAATLDRAKLRAALLATDLPSGATAAGWGVRLDAAGQNSRAEPMLQQWQNGAAVAIGPADAAVTDVVAHFGAA